MLSAAPLRRGGRSALACFPRSGADAIGRRLPARGVDGAPAESCAADRWLRRDASDIGAYRGVWAEVDPVSGEQTSRCAQRVPNILYTGGAARLSTLVHARSTMMRRSTLIFAALACFATAKKAIVVPGWPVLKFPFSTAIVDFKGTLHMVPPPTHAITCHSRYLHHMYLRTFESRHTRSRSRACKALTSRKIRLHECRAASRQRQSRRWIILQKLWLLLATPL